MDPLAAATEGGESRRRAEDAGDVDLHVALARAPEHQRVQQVVAPGDDDGGSPRRRARLGPRPQESLGIVRAPVGDGAEVRDVEDAAGSGDLCEPPRRRRRGQEKKQSGGEAQWHGLAVGTPSARSGRTGRIKASQQYTHRACTELANTHCSEHVFYGLLFLGPRSCILLVCYRAW